MPLRFLLPLLLCLSLCTCSSEPNLEPDVTAAKWELVTIDHLGPEAAEAGDVNPFLQYRVTATFTHADTTIVLPGFFAADGDAAETGADAGNVWRVRFRAPLEGDWSYALNFSDLENGTYRVSGRTEGTLRVGPARAGERGRLARTHPRYLQWRESGEYFLKGGTNSPENLLGFADFDNTYRHLEQFREGENVTEGLHTFSAHAGDAPADAPTWQEGKGKNLFGAINYLKTNGVNSIYFLTMNINGDGKDVWPYVDHETFDRFDVSKLAQWERVFQYADDEGMMLHFVLQETENENLLDGGDTGPLRKLYHRELIARFGHHRAVTWNLGEENGPNSWSDTHQTTEQQAAMIEDLAAQDPYGNYVVLHTHPGEEAFAAIYEPLLGNGDLGGLSLQLGNPFESNAVTKKWLDLSAASGAPWIMTVDETGPWYQGLDPDSGYTLNGGASNNQDSLRALTLWGNLMAGGMGVEWYFGAKNDQNDLSAETFRTRENAWRWTGIGVQFFRDHLPFWEMEGHNELVTGEATCFARPGEVYCVNLPFGQPAELDLGGMEATFSVAWFNPAEGGNLIEYGETVVNSGGRFTLTPPSEQQWIALLRTPGLRQ